jgi:MSHA pilin protein MshD
MRGHRERGATLVELVISIVVVAVAASAVLGVLLSSAIRSADAMVLAQATSLAEAYLEEIALKSFADPDGAAEASRAAYDDIFDYDGLVDAGARDQLGNGIPELAGYRVTVAVVQSAALAGVPASDAARVDVRVNYPVAPPYAVDVALSGYKTRL